MEKISEIIEIFGEVRPETCQHNFIQTEIKPATCIEGGTKTLQCSECQVIQTETIAATGHKPGSLETVKQPTCTEPGSQEQKCTVCGEIMDKKPIPSIGPSFGQWRQTQLR